MRNSDPPMDRDIKIVRQFDKVFETYCITFKKLKEREKQLSLQCFCKEKKTLGDIKIIFVWRSVTYGFLLVATVWETNLT